MQTLEGDNSAARNNAYCRTSGKKAAKRMRFEMLEDNDKIVQGTILDPRLKNWASLGKPNT